MIYIALLICSVGINVGNDQWDYPFDIDYDQNDLTSICPNFVFYVQLCKNCLQKPWRSLLHYFHS